MLYGTSSPPHRNYQSSSRLAVGLGLDGLHLQKIDSHLRLDLRGGTLLGRGTRFNRPDVGTPFHLAGLRGAAHHRLVSRVGARRGSSAAAAQNRRRLDQKVRAGSKLDRGDSQGQWEVSCAFGRPKREGRQAAAPAPAHGPGDVADGLHRSGPRRQGRRVARTKVLFQNRQAAAGGCHPQRNQGTTS